MMAWVVIPSIKLGGYNSLCTIYFHFGKHNNMSLQIIILAAGQGKRMHSTLPKVLHKLAGKSLLSRVVETAQQLNPDAIHLIHSSQNEALKAALTGQAINWVLQEDQLGTGHAVMQALPFIPPESQVLILSADVPLIQADTLQKLIQLSQKAPLALLLANLDNPSELGRILRNAEGEILAIVEEKDASAQQKQIKEIYSGICCVQAAHLARWLPVLGCENAQAEYYLTEIIAMAVAEKLSLAALHVMDPTEIQGINNQLQLQQLERICQQRRAHELLLAGVAIVDAERIDIRGELHCDRDVVIDVNTIFSGKVSLGEGCRIGPNCVLKNVTVGANCEIFANSILEGCEIANNCQIGPFARLRPGSQLAENCKIGNFVETKQAIFDEGSKANHLSYLGDVLVGKQVNIGAGTITCNYDGANKHQTVIEDGAFIGSGTQLVAPITVGANATIGAGSTVRKDAPAEELTLSENKQKTINGWKRPLPRKKHCAG